eukprot:7836620-Alexandrium_andersonii.AAC.1
MRPLAPEAPVGGVHGGAVAPSERHLGAAHGCFSTEGPVGGRESTPREVLGSVGSVSVVLGSVDRF